MKLYRFMGKLIDLELISLIYSDFSEEPTHPFVIIRVEFILGASPIVIQLSLGNGLGGPQTLATIRNYRVAISELEQAWAASGREVQPLRK